MNKNTLLCAGWLLLGASAPALPAFAQADPANPDAAVPATRYQASASYRAPAQQAATPDQNWKQLNQTVAGINSMALTMGGTEDGQAAGGHAEHQHGQPAPQDQHGHMHGQHGNNAKPEASAHGHMGHGQHEGAKK